MECKYDQLSCAGSVDEVVRVTRDFLSTWSVEELSRLPDRCRPAWVASGEDIEFWTDRLQDESESVLLFVEDEHRLDRLTTHFLIASVRLRQLDRAPSNA